MAHGEPAANGFSALAAPRVEQETASFADGTDRDSAGGFEQAADVSDEAGIAGVGGAAEGCHESALSASSLWMWPTISAIRRSFSRMLAASCAGGRCVMPSARYGRPAVW